MRRILVLTVPVTVGAVALSNMTPRATNLPSACENLYTAQISGCQASDFMSQQCSPSCISSLQALVAPLQKACGGQGVSGQNLIVAFLNNVGPQQICHNANSATTQSTTSTPKATTSKESTTSAKPSIISSTSTASTASDASSLLVDTSSSSIASTTTRKHTKAPRPTSQSSSAAPTESSAAAAGTLSTSARKTASKTTTSAGNYQTNLDDGSGGGSPFDTQGNLASAAAGFSLPVLSMILPALAAAVFATFR